MGVATTLDAGVSAYLDTFVTATSSGVASALAPLALTGVTIYIIVMGYAIAQGEVQDSVPTMVRRLFRLSLIAAVALGGGVYQSVVIDFVTGIQGALVGLMSSNPSIPAAIDNMIEPYQVLKAALFKQALTDFWPQWGILVAGLFVAIAHAVVAVVTLGFLLIAKVSLALVLAVGPAFVLCAAWPATQQYAESWVRQAMTFVLLNVLLAASLAMITSLARQFAEHISATSDAMMIIEATVSLLIITVTLAFVVLKHDQLAAALTGGLGMGNFQKPHRRNGGSSPGTPAPSTNNNHISDVSPWRSKPASAAGGAASRGGDSSSAGHGLALAQRYVLDNLRRASKQ